MRPSGAHGSAAKARRKSRALEPARTLSRQGALPLPFAALQEVEQLSMPANPPQVAGFVS